MTTDTFMTRLSKWAAMAPDKPALHGGNPDSITTWTWSQYERDVRTVAKALLSLGVEPGDSVSIIANNRPEWLIADLGIVATRGVPAPIYVTNTAEQVAWVVRHCSAKIVFCDTEEQYQKLASQRGNLPLVETVVLMDEVPGADPDWTTTWSQLMSLGNAGSDDALDSRITSAQPEDLALLCYTSGTTGEPKGVMINHANVVAVEQAVRDRFDYRDLNERSVSYLPLCHVAEHFMTIGLQMGCGSEVYMCDDLLKLKDYLPVAKPTLFLAVPRVWEKFEAALGARLGEATGIKAKLADWALATESTWFEEDLKQGHRTNGITRTIANKLVIHKIKAALGLDEVRYCFSGSAPLNPKTADFFASLGLPIHDVYGMTETSAIITMMLAGVPRSGTVGKPIACVELRIAEDGEILARGPNMTPGYFRGETQTMELLDADGWLHTGDVGHVDADGYLLITDRKKDLFKTSGGKYVAPQMLEAKLKTIRGVGQAVAVGDGQKFIAALVALDPENAPSVAEELGISDPQDLDSLPTDPKMVAYIDQKVADINAGLARFEQIKKVSILPEELSIEAGELTPTLKLKRRIILENHADAVIELYDESIRI